MGKKKSVYPLYDKLLAKVDLDDSIDVKELTDTIIGMSNNMSSESFKTHYSTIFKLIVMNNYLATGKIVVPFKGNVNPGRIGCNFSLSNLPKPLIHMIHLYVSKFAKK